MLLEASLYPISKLTQVQSEHRRTLHLALTCFFLSMFLRSHHVRLPTHEIFSSPDLNCPNTQPWMNKQLLPLRIPAPKPP